MQDNPWVVIDTGTLLTLLLGGESHQPGFAYAKLLCDAQKKGLIKVVIPDMVASEFCGVNAPLYSTDFQPSIIKPENIPMGFSKGQQRIDLIKALIKDGAEVQQTNCGNEYLQRVSGIIGHNPEYRTQRDKVWPPKGEALRLRLTSPRSLLVKALKQNSLVDEHGNAISSGKQDRGELAVADTIELIQQRHGKQSQIFALFEGGDVRGRIIQRLRSPKGSDAYDQLHGKVLPEFNPNDERFEKVQAAALGNINFLSTKGFLAGFMKAAKELSPSRFVKGQEAWCILSPGEAKNKDAMNEAYQGLIKQVNENGLSRVYDKYRDRPINDLQRDDTHEYAMVDHEPQNAPWMNKILGDLQTPEKRESLRALVGDFVAYRQQSLMVDAKLRFEEIMQDMMKMSESTAGDYSKWLAAQIETLARQSGRVQG